MGKVKTVIMGDIEAEEAARKKAEAKREQKRLSKTVKQLDSKTVESKTVSSNESSTDLPGTDLPLNRSTDLPKQAPRKKSQPTNKYTFSRGKKYLEVKTKVDKNKAYSPSEAIKLVKETSFSKFDGTVELHLNVSDKGLRGTVALPHGTGKEVRVKIADDKLVADIAGGGKIDFDILVASPDMMPKLARIAKIIGPKGLMPNPKTGTVGPNPEKLAADLSKGQVQWKTEPTFPIVHTILGKVSFKNGDLEENLAALTKSIGKEKIRSAFVKATMGPAVKVSI